MIDNIIHRHRRSIYDNRGSGLGVILYGITLLLILIFTAINIVNSKVVEDGYNSLRDAVQSASSGSVIHLLTSNRETTTAQNRIISGDNNNQPTYDIYLQLALGYLINRNEPERNSDDTIVHSGDINNFIKLDHQKVVNTTLALLEDAVIRKKSTYITNTEDYKIMMFFIEPYQFDDGRKFFNITAYGNKDYNWETIEGKDVRNIQKELAFVPVSRNNGSNYRNMQKVYKDIEMYISDIVNCKYDGMSDEDKKAYATENDYYINLNSQNSEDFAGLIRKMETYPHYLIVVKDFALPTIFDGETNDNNTGIKSIFGSDKNKLSKPMCALNTGKVERQVEDAGWRKEKWITRKTE